MKSILFFLSLICCVQSNSQSFYLAVKARYSETRLVDDLPNPPKRENRFILSFYAAASDGTLSPISLTNTDLWVQLQGLQYGTLNSGVLDSLGNNYPGYAYTAPKAVAYYNSKGANFVDCDSMVAAHFIVNGYELDCGFVTVSYWETDLGTGLTTESFPAPNVLLPYFDAPHPFYFTPTNLNFDWSVMPPAAPYNHYLYSCEGVEQRVLRGVLGHSGDSVPTLLPVRLANFRGSIDDAGIVKLSWSNMTESNLRFYIVETSADGIIYSSIDTITPAANNGTQVDYTAHTSQTNLKMFYRVRAVEVSGEMSLTQVVRLDKQIDAIAEPDFSFSVFPNPVEGERVTIQLRNAREGRYLAFLVAPDGERFKQVMIMHPGGDLTRAFELGTLPNGIYRLVLHSPTRRYTKTIVYGR